MHPEVRFEVAELGYLGSLGGVGGRGGGKRASFSSNGGGRTDFVPNVAWCARFYGPVTSPLTQSWVSQCTCERSSPASGMRIARPVIRVSGEQTGSAAATRGILVPSHGQDFIELNFHTHSRALRVPILHPTPAASL